jgi:predicted RNA-binding protein YlxR (DUF448 family)
MTTPHRAAVSTKRQPGRPRHVPQRTCVGCRTTAAKRGFVRVVRAPDGGVRVDPTGKASGRGAYLCASPSCWEVALRRGRLAQSLRVTIEDEDRQALAAFAATLTPDDDEEPPAAAGDDTDIR